MDIYLILSIDNIHIYEILCNSLDLVWVISTNTYKEDASRLKSSRALVGAKNSYDQEVKCILTDQIVWKRHCKPKREYLIRLKDLL